MLSGAKKCPGKNEEGSLAKISIIYDKTENVVNYSRNPTKSDFLQIPGKSESINPFKSCKISTYFIHINCGLTKFSCSLSQRLELFLEPFHNNKIGQCYTKGGSLHPNSHLSQIYCENLFSIFFVCCTFVDLQENVPHLIFGNMETYPPTCVVYYCVV